jgi:hypothetical protein
MVYNYMLLSRINERKAPGLDNIPNKFIKIAAEIISPSLTQNICQINRQFQLLIYARRG